MQYRALVRSATKRELHELGPVASLAAFGRALRRNFPPYKRRAVLYTAGYKSIHAARYNTRRLGFNGGMAADAVMPHIARIVFSTL